MNKLDKILKKIEFERQKWLSESENKIIYENEKRNRFIIFSKRNKSIEVSTEHGFSNFIYPNELETLIECCKELGWL